jgi:hypothetical protein
MKKMILYIILFFVLCLGIEGCTVMNLSPKLLFNSSKFKQFPVLDDGLQTDKFSIHRITQSSNIEISYFPQKNFFLIFNSNKAGHFNPIKIDSMGNKVFELEITEKHSLGLIEVINCFLIGTDSIYDLSDSNPVATPFSEILNKNGDIPHKEWVEKVFGKLYNVSDVVLYGREDGRYVVYFHYQEKWTKLYTPLQYPYFVYPDTGSKVVCEINEEKIPHKWEKEVYLKDVKNNTYSNGHRYTDGYISQYNTSFFPDQTHEYPQAGTIKTLAFSKEYAYVGPYNPGIPTKFYGIGYYALEIENSILNFRAVASKSSFFGNVETDLHLFGLPTQYTNQSNVCFLTYDYSTNYHENGKKGVYVIKKN